MQDYKEIVEQMKNNANKAHELEERNKAIYRDRTKDDEYARNAEMVQDLFLLNKILTDNARRSAVAYLLPIFSEIIAKYRGKQYGQKTKEKISEEMRERTGFRVYIYANSYSQEIHFYDNYFGYTNTKLELYLMNHDYILVDSNRITDFNAENARLSYCKPYCEEPLQRLEEIKQARQEAKRVYEQAEQAFRRLNELSPSSVDYVGVNSFRGYFN